MAREVSQALAAEGCHVELLFNVRGSVDAAAANGFDLIVVGALLHDEDFAGLYRSLRQSGDDLAVLAFATRGQAQTVVAARLHASTSLELLGRVVAALHRLRCGRSPARTISVSDLRIDFELGSAQRGGRPISLTAKELDLLRHLVEHRPTAISRDELLRTVWEYQDGVSTRTVDVHMSSLRQKLERDPRRPKHLRTVRGVGYRFLA